MPFSPATLSQLRRVRCGRSSLAAAAMLMIGLSGCSGGAASESQNATAQQSFDAGLAAAQTGQHPQAVQDLTRAVERGGLPVDLHAQALVQRAVSRAETGEHAQALAELDAAEKEVPELSDLYAARARVYFLQGDPAKARTEFHRARTLNKLLKLPKEYQ